MAVINVNGFKQGMAAILEKHNLSSLESLDEGESLIQLSGDDCMEVQFIVMRTCHPGPLLDDTVEFKDYDPKRVMSDIIGLFKYFGVMEIKASDDYFFMGYDDGGSFVFENVMIMGDGKNEDHTIQQ